MVKITTTHNAETQMKKRLGFGFFQSLYRIIQYRINTEGLVGTKIKLKTQKTYSTRLLYGALKLLGKLMDIFLHCKYYALLNMGLLLLPLKPMAKLLLPVVQNQALHLNFAHFHVSKVYTHNLFEAWQSFVPRWHPSDE